MRRFRTTMLGAGTSLVLVLSACGNGPPPDQSSGAGGAGAAGGGGGGSAIATVTGVPAVTTIKQTDDLKFVPATATAKAGDVIEFDNSGTTPHNVTFDGGPASPTMNGGDKFEVKIAKPGTYHYVCTFHAPNMAGTLTVS
jgi:plastocyanin